MDGLRFITIVKVKKYHIYNKKGHSRKEGKRKEKEEKKNTQEKRAEGEATRACLEITVLFLWRLFMKGGGVSG